MNKPLATIQFLDQTRLDVVRSEDALVPRVHRSVQVGRKDKAERVFMPVDELERIAACPPNQEHESRPQRKICHRIRKAVRSLTKRERKIIKLLFFEDINPSEVAKIMRIEEVELAGIVCLIFAKLKEQIKNLDCKQIS